MMLQLQLLVLSLALAPNLVSAALFPRNSQVKMIGHKEFKEAMKQNVFILYSVPPNQLLSNFALPQMTSVVAFVAPWCGVSPDSHAYSMIPLS